MSNRRKFIKGLGATTILAAASVKGLASESYIETRRILANKQFTLNDELQIGCIGMGIMGFENVRTALKVPGVKMVAACDLYKGRLERSKELFGKDLFVTEDYKALLARKDIDAVIVATSDQWHDIIANDAMRAGKAVYLEKPMVHKISQGKSIIDTAKATGQVLQVGSQRVSSVVMAKAKELYQAGEIGKITCVEASFERHSANGAWQYTFPTDVSEQTVNWKRYLRDNKNLPFDPKKFFWWRNYKEFGTGVAGDLFVHLLSGIHFMTDSLGPTRIYSTGDLAYWKDGRNVPDIMTAILEYPQTDAHPPFQVQLRVNFTGTGDGHTRLYGTEGNIDLGWNDVVVHRAKFAKAPGYGGWDSFSTYPLAEQEKIKAEYYRKYKEGEDREPRLEDIKYAAPENYDERLDHFINLFEAMRNGKKVVEDASFGLRAAAPCLACNDSYFQKKEINWDPVNMQVV